MIQIKNITKSYSNREIVKDVSFTFEAGKTNIIIGESGSGKTTLIRCMVGLDEPDKGEVLFDGRNFYTLDIGDKKEIRKEIGMLFQGGALFDSQTVEENVMFPLSMFTDLTYSEKLDRTNFCLNRVNLENANKLYPSELSGGMKKRVAIARAIVKNAPILVLDEATSSLDSNSEMLIQDALENLMKNKTTIVIAHRLSTIQKMDRIIVVDDGKIIEQGSHDELLENENSLYKKLWELQAGGFLEDKEDESEEVNVENNEDENGGIKNSNKVKMANF